MKGSNDENARFAVSSGGSVIVWNGSEYLRKSRRKYRTLETVKIRELFDVWVIWLNNSEIRKLRQMRKLRKILNSPDFSIDAGGIGR
jgi:hypothetical protein